MNNRYFSFLFVIIIILFCKKALAMEFFPGVQPFTVEREKWMNSGVLSHSVVSFTDAKGSRFFLKPGGIVSEFFYQYFARQLGVPCQYSWQWTRENATMLDPENKLSKETRSPYTYVIKYEPNTIQSSFVLGGDHARYNIRNAIYNYKKSIKISVSDTEKLEKLESTARKLFQELEQKEFFPFKECGKKIGFKKNSEGRLENPEEDCKKFGELLEKLYQNIIDYPILHTKEAKPQFEVLLSPRGQEYSGVREWLMKIPTHKETYNNQEDEPLDFDAQSLIAIQVLNHIFGLTDRTWHNLLYNYKTKKFIAIDNETVGLSREFPDWYKPVSWRPSRFVFATPEQKTMFEIYRDELQKFLDKYPNPESVIQEFKSKFSDEDYGAFAENQRKKLELVYPKIKQTIDLINADLQNQFNPDIDSSLKQPSIIKQDYVDEAEPPVESEKPILPDQTCVVGTPESIIVSPKVPVITPKDYSETIRAQWTGKKIVGTTSLGVILSVGLMLGIDTIKRKGLHPELKKMDGRLKSLKQRWSWSRKNVLSYISKYTKMSVWRNH